MARDEKFNCESVKIDYQQYVNTPQIYVDTLCYNLVMDEVDNIDESLDGVDRLPNDETVYKLDNKLERVKAVYNEKYITPIVNTPMLRDYEYTENWRLLDRALEYFIDLPDRLSLVGYSALSPDSFLWKIFDGENIYYLYAEDYVPSLEHVRERILDFLPKKIDLEFMPAKQPLVFEDSSPKQLAKIYKPPENEYEFSRYAAQSGFDFVFLLKSSEKSSGYEDGDKVEGQI